MLQRTFPSLFVYGIAPKENRQSRPEVFGAIGGFFKVLNLQQELI